MSDFDFGSCDNRADMDNSFNMLRKDLDDIDIPSELDNSMMTSDFFDSVFPLGPGCFDEDLNMNRTMNLDIDGDLGMSSDADDMRLTNSCSPDSAGSSTGYELNDFILVNDDQLGETVNLVTGEVTRSKNPAPIQQKPKIFINKPNPRKMFVTKSSITKPVKKFTPSSKPVIRVQSIPGSKKSLLIPFNVTKMKNIKIVKGNSMSMKAEDLPFTNINDTPVSQKSYLDSYDLTTSPDTFDEDSDSVDTRLSDNEHQYPLLSLTEEEQRLLIKEGICLPTHYPLSKQEERELKRIRRKIRNKISAQDSRKRKKEYVDGLEESVRQGVEERKILMTRINQLQKLNSRIMLQMGKLQALVCNTSSTKATPTASLLIVLLSVLLVTLPNLRTPQDTEWKDQQQVAARRALLSCKAHCEEVQNLEEFLTFNNEDEDESELQNMLYEDDKIAAKFSHMDQNLKGLAKHFLENQNNVQGMLNLELDDDIRNTFIKVKKFCNEELDFLKVNEKVPVKRKFIEPDIDEFIDYGPPPKIMKISNPVENYNGNIEFDVSTTVSVNSSEKE